MDDCRRPTFQNLGQSNLTLINAKIRASIHVRGRCFMEVICFQKNKNRKTKMLPQYNNTTHSLTTYNEA